MAGLCPVQHLVPLSVHLPVSVSLSHREKVSEISSLGLLSHSLGVWFIEHMLGASHLVEGQW